MHKNKEGKVVASLTEVKNRTGDIFALVDEFGEVFLTSYNKIRYRISKTDIANVIELAEEKKSQAKVKKEKPVKAAVVVPTPTPVVEKIVEPVVEEVVEAPAAKPKAPKAAPVETPDAQTQDDDFAKKISKYESWDRNDKGERTFVDSASQPLVNN